MPNFDYNFTNEHYQLIASQEETTWNSNSQNYIRLIIRNSQNGKIANSSGIGSGPAIFYASLNSSSFEINISPFGVTDIEEVVVKTIGSGTYVNDNGDTVPYNDFQIYQNPDGNIYIKPNEILNTYGLLEGDYRIQTDFLNQLKPSYSDEFLATLPYPIYFEEYDINQDGALSTLDKQPWINVGRRDIANDEVFSDGTEPSAGEDAEQSLETFYNPYFNINVGYHHQFIIRQISTSRKEVRLKLIDRNITKDDPLIESITNALTNYGDTYAFRHVLNNGSGNNLPITNFHFDSETGGEDDQSLILRLYVPIANIPKKLVSIEREVLITQTEEIYYFSEEDDKFLGESLTPDSMENWINPHNNEIEYQDYNDLTSSISEASIENILSSSIFDYPNLNVDFNEFENHTFFGSARRKLKNFKNKIEKIQNYLGDISSSLYSKNDIDSYKEDSNAIKQTRKETFNKINNELKSFTPYERFLYYDGQSETTASAPGLGKNYAATIPVQSSRLNDDYALLNNYDGFSAVYKHSTSQNNAYIDLFTDMYFAHNKPFFNHSGSIYLSFLLKGDDLDLNWNPSNHQNYNGMHPDGTFLPSGSQYINRQLFPPVTGSEYRRFIAQASQSYWAPTAHAPTPYDMSSINDWGNGSSNQYEILSGSIKTGSNQIKDSDGNYPTTVVTQSGADFYGSCMPAGELFRIWYPDNSWEDNLQGYWNIDNVTSASVVGTDDVTNDARNFGDASSIAGVFASDGVTSRDRQYGTSYYIVSESAGDSIEGIEFESSNFNFSKDDNFSLSIWVKRFHPNTGSADSSNPARPNQEIFMRGKTNESYGIDYRTISNSFRVGVRSGSTSYSVTKTMSDDGLNWHHIVMTYQSGSSTGIKLYVDGTLEGNATNIGVGEFSSSVATGDDALTMGQTSVLAGSGDPFNGFLQYPRVFNKTLSAAEVTELYLHPDGVLRSKVTDVKVTFKDPTDVLPFDNIFHTSSANWTDWYNGMYDSASAFDASNIHSLESNLPLYIQESSEYNDLKDFLSLQGEQYDIIRNHIDGLETIHKRGYTKTDSPPENVLPVILDNLNWKAINPFTGSLAESFEGVLSGVTSIDDVRNNTWRKTLNNLIYIYKSKGTENSIRALLNVYGYPPDVLPMQEYGGSTDNQISIEGILNDSTPTDTEIDLDLNRISGSIGFTQKKQKLNRFMFKNKPERTIRTKWWMDSADINTVGFIYKHTHTTNTQEILKSSGSGGETLWDLRLVPSSDGASSSFEFRLNNTETGSLVITASAVSMSTDYKKMLNGQIWNVMLQRMSSSISGSGTNEYRLHSSLQDKQRIKTYNYVTMSVSGGSTVDSNYRANQNWPHTGSFKGTDIISSSNLYIGETMSGSLSEIKAWSTPLSISRFRQHTLNKFSTVGNTINSHKDELVYHFKLNENYTSASISSSTQNIYLFDAAPKTTFKDYSFLISGSLISGSYSSLYGFDYIDVVKFGLQDNTQNNANNKSIVINPKRKVIGNLSPDKPALKSLTRTYGSDKPSLVTSNKLELYRSPQDFINDYILNNMDNRNFELYYGNPQSVYSSSYTEFDTLRKEFFEAHPIEININKYIRANESMFNYSIVEALKQVVPARSTLSDRQSNMGVMIKPTILEKQKRTFEQHSTETNPNLATGSIVITKNTDYKSNFVLTSSYELPKSGSTSVNDLITMPSQSITLPYSSSINVSDSGSNLGLVQLYTSSLELPHSSSINVVDSGSTLGLVQLYTSSLELPYSSSIKIVDSGSTLGLVQIYTSSLELPKSGSTSVNDVITINTGSLVLPHSGSTAITASFSGSELVHPKSGSIDYASIANESFIDVHKNWGTSSADVHFINFASNTGSEENHNVGHIDNRFNFYSIGDVEIYSASLGTGSNDSSNFTNQSKFYNRQQIKIDIHKDIIYESYISGSTGPQVGRAMGKTRYFSTSSDGTITLPSNHVNKFSYPFKDTMYMGSQNTNPGFLQVKQEDYSSASFYRAKVTGGENEIVIRKGKGNIDDNDRIIYS